MNEHICFILGNYKNIKNCALMSLKGNFFFHNVWLHVWRKCDNAPWLHLLIVYLISLIKHYLQWHRFSSQMNFNYLCKKVVSTIPWMNKHICFIENYKNIKICALMSLKGNFFFHNVWLHVWRKCDNALHVHNISWVPPINSLLLYNPVNTNIVKTPQNVMYHFKAFPLASSFWCILSRWHLKTFW